VKDMKSIKVSTRSITKKIKRVCLKKRYAYLITHKAQHAASTKKYYEKNKVKWKAYAKAYYQKNKEVKK